jgi:hypothetical protein
MTGLSNNPVVEIYGMAHAATGPHQLCSRPAKFRLAEINAIRYNAEECWITESGELRYRLEVSTSQASVAVGSHRGFSRLVSYRAESPQSLSAAPSGAGMSFRFTTER